MLNFHTVEDPQSKFPIRLPGLYFGKITYNGTYLVVDLLNVEKW